MAGEFDRLNMLIGSDALSRLAQAHVVLFGVGGVGGFAAEALARSGVGHVTLIDGDRVAMSNINRQIVALHSTLGEYKVEAARRRMLDINPECAWTRWRACSSRGCGAVWRGCGLRYRCGRHGSSQACVGRVVHRHGCAAYKLHGYRKQVRPDAAGGRRHLFDGCMSAVPCYEARAAQARRIGAKGRVFARAADSAAR